MADNNICNICGANYIFKNGQYVCPCCDHIKPINVSNDEQVRLILASSKLRLGYFDEAIELYEDMIKDYKESAEAYFGLLLASFGIIYEKDDNDIRAIPTCHNTKYESFYDNKNYELAIRYANEDSKIEYQKKAETIEKIRKEWINIASSEKPYDIFLSYKDKEDDKKTRTEDSYEVYDIYNYLTSKGYRVFFSRVTLKDKAGEKYEPYIFNALNTAKLMIVYASKLEYIKSPWVKNEWSRFYKRIENKEKSSNSLVVVCKDINPGSLPKKLANNQQINRNSITFADDLLSYVEKILTNKDETKKDVKYCLNCLSENPIKTKHCIECDGVDFVSTLNEALKIKNEKEQEKVRKQLEEEYQRKQEELVRKVEEDKRNQEEAAKKLEEESKKQEEQRKILEQEYQNKQKELIDKLEEEKRKQLELTNEYKYCKKCKTRNSFDAKFCKECGSNEFVKSLDEVIVSEIEQTNDVCEVIDESKNDESIFDKYDSLKNIMFIRIGEYPQSLVTDKDIIYALDKINKVNEQGYKVYDNEKYIKINGSEYIDNKGNVVKKGFHYYKVEPIKWRYLGEMDENALFVSEYILDCNCFDGKSNNYQNSEIRNWLNNYFLDIALNSFKSKIVTSKVDNSPKSTGYKLNEYCCDATFDKVFLLSKEELCNQNYNFYSDFERSAMTTEYARARGCFSSLQYNGYYWTRSPDSYSKKCVLNVSYDGFIDKGRDVIDKKFIFGSNVTYEGVRPAIVLKR